MATCEAHPACDARRTASSFVRFLPPLLTPHGGAASPPSFTRAGAAGEDTLHCATRDARRAPRAGPVTVALRSLVHWVSRFLLLLVTLGLALSYICMCAMRRPRLARELNLARSAQKKRKKKKYLKKREKRTSAIQPLPGFFSVFAFVRAVEEGARSRRTRGRARAQGAGCVLLPHFPPRRAPAIWGNSPLFRCFCCLGDDDELNINPPTPCQIGKRPPAPKPAPPIEQSTPGFANNSRVRALPHVHPRGLGSRPSSLRGLNGSTKSFI